MVQKIVRKNHKLVARMVKAATAVIGGSLVLSEKHPYITLFVLALGAIANEYIIYEQERINKSKDVY